MKKERIPSQKEKDYQRRVNEKMPKSKTFLQCVRAFISGGIICCIGQLIHDFAKLVLNFSESNVAAFTAIVLVFLGATLTGIGVYDNIGSWAGAGSVVPITGFANSIVSPAMEFHSEGFILGTAANMFKLAGPVIVFGCGSAVVYGLIIYIFGWY